MKKAARRRLAELMVGMVSIGVESYGGQEMVGFIRNTVIVFGFLIFGLAFVSTVMAAIYDGTSRCAPDTVLHQLTGCQP
jgi:hypothetical protein